MLKTMLTDLLTSKKALAALTGVVVALGARVGLHLDSEAIQTILLPIIAYILGQGAADFGKEARKHA